jgi:hypothetical protein
MAFPIDVEMVVFWYTIMMPNGSPLSLEASNHGVLVPLPAKLTEGV